MSNDQRKIEQMKLFRLWDSKQITTEVYFAESLKLMQRFAAAFYGKKRAS